MRVILSHRDDDEQLRLPATRRSGRSCRNRILFLAAVLALAGLLCPGYHGAHAASSFQDTERDSLARAIAATMMRSIEISLEEAREGGLASWIDDREPPSRLSGATLGELAGSLRTQLLEALSREQPGQDPRPLETAIGRSIRFLRLDDRPLAEDVPMAATVSGTGPAPASFTREVEDATSAVAEACWPGIASYAEDRLGPVKELLRTLTAADHVILTNARGNDVFGPGPRPCRFRRFHLPLSSYGKEIGLAILPDGTRHVVLSGFDSRSYLRHFGLLVNRFRRDRGLSFRILERVDPARLERSYDQLLDFAREHSEVFRGLDTLVIGYASEFHRLWADHRTVRLVQAGTSGETWECSVYRFPEGATVGVLGGDVDYYGEGLARQLGRLVAEFPVRRIFFGGSGGGTIPRPRYELYFPTTIRSPDGFSVRNVLMGSTGAGTHLSVDSPLLETPLFLKRAQMEYCTTIDMEAGHLARLAATTGIQLGVGILLTDFPPGFGNLDTTLAEQDFQAKIASRETFVRAVEAAIRQGGVTWADAIERWAGRSIPEISRENLERFRREIGPITDGEREILRRLHTLPFRIVVRMSPGRLSWALKDGALFSTGLLRALGQKTDPYTPSLENEMFGAYDYVFASYCTDLGQRIYGDVAVILKPEEVLPRAWATRPSGWRVAGYNPGKSLEFHRQEFLKEVQHPDQFREAIELQAVYRLRRLRPSERERLLERDVETWPPLLYELGFGKLEVKIRSHVLRREIERVLLPPTARGEIPRLLRSHGIPFAYYHPDQAILPE